MDSMIWMKQDEGGRRKEEIGKTVCVCMAAELVYIVCD